MEIADSSYTVSIGKWPEESNGDVMMMSSDYEAIMVTSQRSQMLLLRQYLSELDHNHPLHS